MAVFTCARGSAALSRHWPYFLRQEADRNYIITTTSTPCETPEGVSTRPIGIDSYLNGPHLPNRMLDTIESMLQDPWSHLMLTEYDTLILKPIPAESVMTVAGHLAGGPTWGSRANCFLHNPWVFARDAAMRFLPAGRKAVAEGWCPRNSAESSPDVFLAAVCEANHIPMQTGMWTEYSRNSLDVSGHLEEARKAYRSGVDVIHGCKHQNELDFILS